MKRMDDAPLSAFHLRLTTYTAGGMFCDGYIIGSIGLALPLLTTQMGLGSIWEGLLGAAALIGLFVGAVVFGPITDRVGRQKILVIDLMVFVVASLAQLFVTEPVLLLVLRLILGIAIGADYAIAPSLLSEFVPRKNRGQLLAAMQAVWTAGFIVAYLVGLGLRGALDENSWKWMLASSAVPAVITLLLRLGAPESPRWLASKGRHEESEAIIVKYFGPEYSLAHHTDHRDVPRASWRVLFSKRYRALTLFAGMFWFCQVFPYFGIGTFLPRIVDGFGIENQDLGIILYNVVLLVGAIGGCLIMDKVSRRSFVIWSFVIVGLGLFALGLVPHSPLWFLVPVFLIVAFVLSAAADLEEVYPAEIFPTEVRASGVGAAAGISRIGAAISTFVLPSVLDAFGVGTTMLLLAGVVGLGLALSIPLAPETRGALLDHSAEETAKAEASEPT